MMILEQVLTSDDLVQARAILAEAAWIDGKATAGAAAKDVKNNLQAQGEPLEALEHFIAQALDRHPVFASAAQPRRFSRLLFSRYEPGMAYGAHTDDALMGPPYARLRTDLAFTLFLTGPETYEGGALSIGAQAGAHSVKLPAGDAILYAAGTIHEVEPVTQGARLACVGWIESRVRDAAAREVLFDLTVARANLAAAGAAREDLLLLDKARSNLLRMWAET
jgi:PKHD-type hydroxylase